MMHQVDGKTQIFKIRYEQQIANSLINMKTRCRSSLLKLENE